MTASWPTCPTCRNPMWQGWVDAPQRIVRGCGHCRTHVQVPPVVEVELPELALFEAPT